MGNFKEFCQDLEEKIKQSYEQGVSITAAELLAAEFLSAQLKVSEELKAADLDSRMRKSGVKAVKAAIYLDIVQKSDKKPTEAQIQAMIDIDKIVQDEQKALDTAEVEKGYLERVHNTFENAHVYYRGVSKGRYE